MLLYIMHIARTSTRRIESLNEIKSEDSEENTIPIKKILRNEVDYIQRNILNQSSLSISKLKPSYLKLRPLHLSLDETRSALFDKFEPLFKKDADKGSSSSLPKRKLHSPDIPVKHFTENKNFG